MILSLIWFSLCIDDLVSSKSWTWDQVAWKENRWQLVILTLLSEIVISHNAITDVNVYYDLHVDVQLECVMNFTEGNLVGKALLVWVVYPRNLGQENISLACCLLDVLVNASHEQILQCNCLIALWFLVNPFLLALRILTFWVLMQILPPFLNTQMH